MDEFLKYCAEVEAGDIYSETVVLEKEGLVSVLNAVGCVTGAIISQIDPRNENPTIAVFPTIEAAKEIMQTSIKTSKERGWKVILKGKPKWSW
jgi:hypothetical protein